MKTMFFAVSLHGTAGLGNSYGYAYICEYNPDMPGGSPQSDQTTTIYGPYTYEQAEREVARMEALCAAYRERSNEA